MVLMVLLGSLAVICGISLSLLYALSDVRRRTGFKDEVSLPRANPMAYVRHRSTYRDPEQTLLVFLY